MGFIDVISRRAGGFHRLAKCFELHFFSKTPFLYM